MCVRYMWVESSFKRCPGRGPQGGLLTGLLFIVQVNKAGRPCSLLPALGQNTATLPTADSHWPELPVPRQQHAQAAADHRNNFETPITGQQRALPPPSNTEGPEIPAQRQNPVPLPLCHSQHKLNKKSFVDDLTLLEKISLSKLQTKERIIGPLSYHD